MGADTIRRASRVRPWRLGKGGRAAGAQGGRGAVAEGCIDALGRLGAVPGSN